MHAQIDRLCFSPTNWFEDGRAKLGQSADRHLAVGRQRGRARVLHDQRRASQRGCGQIRAHADRTVHKVLTAYRSFHGSAAGAAALTGENRRWTNEPDTMPGVVRFWAAYPYRSPFSHRRPEGRGRTRARASARRDRGRESRLDRGALIEPVVGSNGVIVPPDGYLAGLRAICDEHGILLIFDEVMTGFGRTGAAFGATRFDVVPDMITFAKGVTSAYAPLGGVMMREKLAKAFDTRPLGAGHTYSGHPLSMAAGLAAHRCLPGRRLLRARPHDRGLAALELGKLREKHELIGDVRGIGAFFALEFVSDRAKRTPLDPVAGQDARRDAGALRRLAQARCLRFRPLQRHARRAAAGDRRSRTRRSAGRLDGAIGELEAAYAASLK